MEARILQLPWLGIRLDMPNEVGGGLPRCRPEVLCGIELPSECGHLHVTPWAAAVLAAVWNYNILKEPQPVCAFRTLGSTRWGSAHWGSAIGDLHVGDLHVGDLHIGDLPLGMCTLGMWTLGICTLGICTLGYAHSHE